MATGKDYIDLNSVFRLIQASEGGNFRFGDLLVEVGQATFDGIYTDATDRPVVTQLNQIEFGVAVPFDSYSPATDATLAYTVIVAPDVTEDTDSNLKTFSIHRSSLGAVSGLKCSYVVIGRHFATD